MNLGTRIRQARQEAGLSQSQLSEGLITRNMLSQIENGSAKPSVPTLEELARRLQKPVGFFFGEEPEKLAGRAQAEAAWQAWKQGNPLEAARILDRQEDSQEFEDIPFLKVLILLELSEKAIQEGRVPYAWEMLRYISREHLPVPDLQKRVLLLRGRLEGQSAAPVCRELPSMDEELLLRARGALEEQDPKRAGELLEAAENKESPQWNMLRGKAYLLQLNYRGAAQCFHKAEVDYPRETALWLEQCYRELEDFKQAYYYACRQK